MATSRSPYPLRRDPFQPPTTTPGPLGHNDAASPDTPISFVGDTPGPLGVNDWADPSLVNRTTRDTRGGATTEGRLTLANAQAMALEITTYFEGGKSMNYRAIADDFDGQGTSFGLLQWNFGQNTLGPLLKKMLLANPTRFRECFGQNTDYEALVNALLLANQNAQLIWARNNIKKNRAEWQGSFEKLGSIEPFNQIQREEAVKQYHQLVLSAIKTLRDINPIAFRNIEFRTYVALFDLCVQQHGLGKVQSQMSSRVKLLKSMSQLEITKIAVTERGRSAKKQYQADCISRRMGILAGSNYKASMNGFVAERKNPKLALVRKYGGMHVINL